MLKVSVIIPTYNRPNELNEAVQSVLKQSIAPNEIVIVNDGDNHEILERFSKHKIIKVLHNSKSKGSNFSRNRGADESQYDILMFLDDDDTWNENKIKNQLSIFASSSNIGLVYSNRWIIDENHKAIKKITSKIHGDLYPSIFFSNIIGPTSSVGIRRDVFYEAGGFDELLPAMQDYDLWIRACKLCQVGLDIEHALNYRVSNNFENQITGSVEKKKIAVKHILKKYNTEISNFSFWQEKKLHSKLYLSIARSCGKKSFGKLFKYCFMSFVSYPSLKSLAPLLSKMLKK